MRVPTRLGDKIRVDQLIGGGAFGKVYRGVDEQSQVVAIKMIKKSRLNITDPSKAEETVTEAVAMAKINEHDNVIKVHNLFGDRKAWYIIMEYAENGEFFDFIQQGLRPEVALHYFRQLISAINFMHLRNICHRDLKLENILLDTNYNLKLCDFGLAKEIFVGNQPNILTTMCGSPAYVAPEVLSGQGYEGQKADIWSCGVILFAMITSCLPTEDSAIDGDPLYERIKARVFDYPPWGTTITGHLADLLQRIFDPNPETRITIPQIMAHPWYQGSTIEPFRGPQLISYMLEQKSQRTEITYINPVPQDFAYEPPATDATDECPPLLGAPNLNIKHALHYRVNPTESYKDVFSKISEFLVRQRCEVAIVPGAAWVLKAKHLAKPACFELRMYRRQNSPVVVLEYVRTLGQIHTIHPIINLLRDFLA